MARAKRIIFAALSVLMIASVVSAEEQQCWTQVEPLWSCGGPRPDYGRVISALPAWAPMPARIVRASIEVLGGSVGGGPVDLGLDPGSEWSRVSRWPMTQDGPLDRMTGLVAVALLPNHGVLQPRIETFNPPIVFRPGDAIIAVYSCYGGGEIIMVWQICWAKP